MKRSEPGSYQRRQRVFVLTSLLAAVFVLPVWPALAAGLVAQAAFFYALLPGRPSQAILVFSGGIFMLVPSLILEIPEFGSFPLGLLLACVLLILALGTYLSHHIQIPSLPARLLCVAVTVLLLCMIVMVYLQVARPGDFSWASALPAAVGIVLAGLERWRWRWIHLPRARKAKLSVILVCQDEADRIDECLSRVVDWADEIIVFDSGSTDGTVARVRRYTDRVWETDWQGYSRQKQRALEQCSMDWVLSIDADEYVTAELKREIDAHLSAGPKQVAFKMPWVSRVFGDYVFFGADGRYHKRLFRRELTRFNSADVHEDIEISGPIGTLSAPVIHDTFRTYEHLRAKFMNYALLSARRIARRKRPIPVLEAWIRGIMAFLILYFRRMGFADGRRGLLMATVYASYTFDKYAAAWTLRHSGAAGSAPADNPSAPR